MVILIIAGLMALAAPFLFSMTLQKRASSSDLHAMAARQGSQAALAHGIAGLHGIARLNGVEESPETTSLEDLRFPMAFTSASGELDTLGLNPENQCGALWSLHIDDEQGKVNLNCAPPVLLGNLLGSGILKEQAAKGDRILHLDDTNWCSAAEFSGPQRTVCIEGETLRCLAGSNGIIRLAEPLKYDHAAGALVYDGRARKIANWPFTPGQQPFSSIYQIKSACAGLAPDEFARLERLLTTCSGLDGPQWGKAVSLASPEIHAADTSFIIEAHEGYIPEMMIRVTWHGDAQAYGRLLHTKRNQDTTMALETDAGIGADVGDAHNKSDALYIEPLMEAPININTAPRGVLIACFKGLCLHGSNHAISRENAEALADYLIGAKRVFGTRDDLIKVFEEARKALNLSFAVRDACLINAIEPRNAKLRTATVPFCFHSWGSYTLEGAGVENAANGSQFARNILRQLVTMPTPWPGRFKIAYQQGFQNLIDLGQTQRLVSFRLPVAKLRATSNQENFQALSSTDGNIRLDVGHSGVFHLMGEFYDPCETLSDPGYRQDGYDMTRRDPWVLKPIVSSSVKVIVPPPDDEQSTPRDTTPVLPPSPPPPVGAKIPPPKPRKIVESSIQLPIPHRSAAPAEQLVEPTSTEVACLPTSVEAWVRPLDDHAFVVYDEGLEEHRNRVTFAYDPHHQPASGMVISICDAGLECSDAAAPFKHLQRKPVEFIYPVTLDAGDWWHVAGSWKTSQPNGQEIRIDAQPVPNSSDGPIVNRPGTHLAKDLNLDDVNSLSLEEADKADYPVSGAVKIGEEIIEYKNRQGTEFSVLTRGARLSAAVRHSRGEAVMPFGYSNPLADILRVGGGTLSDKLPAPSVARCHVEIPRTRTERFVLDSDTSSIPVDDASAFPSCGFVECEGEVLFYGSRTNKTLDDLVRGYKGPMRNLHDGSPIELVSLQISNYAKYESNGIVQIDDAANSGNVEWLAYGSKVTQKGKRFLLGVIGDSNPRGQIRVGLMDQQAPGFASQWKLAEFRNKFGIGADMAHAASAKVIPVAHMSGPHCGDRNSPFGENGVSEISVVEQGQTDGDLRYVKQAYTAQSSNGDGWTFDFYCGLNDFVSRDFPAAAARFLKWPSGELPDAVGAWRHILSDFHGENTLKGHADEVLLNTHLTNAGRVAMTVDGGDLKAGDDTVDIEQYDAWPQNGRVEAAMNWPQAGGLIRIENELMFYQALSQEKIKFYADVLPYLKDKPMSKAKRSIEINGKKEEKPNIHTRTVTHLTGVIRGVFGSAVANHPAGAAAMLFDGMPVSVLTNNFREKEDALRVKNGSGFPLEGYALIGNQRSTGEVVSWTRGGSGGNGQPFNDTNEPHAAYVSSPLHIFHSNNLQDSHSASRTELPATLTGCSAFRGRFGTGEEDHDAGELVRCLPFRYWDRDVRTYDGAGQAYMEAGYSARGGKWNGIELKLTGTEEQPLPAAIRPHILVRYNHKPEWETEPSNQDGGIYEFLNAGEWTPLGDIHADEIEVRVYWNFRRGAFQPGLDWKRTFSIEKLRVRYDTPLIIRRLDELEKR